MERYFTIVWWVVMAYVLIGNYIYFRKVLPRLRQNNAAVGPSIGPSGQLKQIEEYLGLLSQFGERPWHFHYLRHLKFITIVVLGLMVPIFVSAISNAF